LAHFSILLRISAVGVVDAEDAAASLGKKFFVKVLLDLGKNLGKSD